jgi:inner membrane protein
MGFRPSMGSAGDATESRPAAAAHVDRGRNALALVRSMPSAITHAFTGAAISTLAPRRFRGMKLGIALSVAAALPDLDVLAFRFGIPYSHPFGHRGFTHSLLFAFLLAVVLWLWLTRNAARLSKPSVGLFLVVVLACASHGFLDAFTDAGLGVGFFVPVSSTRYFFPWRPILTSPLNPREFFTGQGLTILTNEIGWVWFPTGLMVAAVLLLRPAASRPSPPTGRPCAGRSPH